MAEDTESRLKEIDARLSTIIQPELRKVAEAYIAHIDAYAREAAGKREIALKDESRGKFLDFRKELSNGKQKEVTYAGEWLDGFLRSRELATAYLLMPKVVDALMEVLRERHGEAENRKHLDRNASLSLIFGAKKEYWLQQTYVPGMQSPFDTPYVLLKRVEG